MSNKIIDNADLIFQTIKKFMYKIVSSFFRTKAVLKLLSVIVAVILLVQFIGWLPTLQVRRGVLPQRIPPAPALSLGEIPIEAGITLVAANGGKEMFVDPATGNISVLDINTGFVWNSFRQEEDATPEEMSLLRVSFISEDNVISNWYSFNFSQRNGDFTAEKIQNGVRLNIQIGNADPTNINDFMPRRIAINRFQSTFVESIDEKLSQGIISLAEANRHRTNLRLVYGRDEARGFYYNRLHTSPPLSVIQQMLSMTRLLGYTFEQMLYDEAPFNLAPVDRRPPVGFLIPVEFVLDNGDLVVSITTEHIKVENNFYTLTRLQVLPNFGSVSLAESAGGYIFVPDGSGALLALNSFDPSFSMYERPIFRNAIFRDLGFMPNFPEYLTMPVYGMLHSFGGFMGIIEKGTETAFIGARVASSAVGAGGNVFNVVYSGFDVTQFRQINIVGAVEHGGTFTVSTGMLGMDFVVRKKLFGSPATYFDMVVLYRNYLIERYGLELDFSDTPEIFLDVIGALTIEGRFMGIAYEHIISMTTYTDLLEILKDLQDISVTVSYNGVFNDGINNRLANRATLVSQNGSTLELERLLEFASNTGVDIFFGTNIARTHRLRGNGFRERIHASYGFDGAPARFTSYDPSTRMPRALGTSYVLLNPIFLLNVVDGFLAGANHFDKLFIYDLGQDYHASYRRHALVPPLASSIIVNKALRRLAFDDKSLQRRRLALNNPRIDRIQYADWAVNISRESSNFGAFYTSIPFRQLVMNGLVRHTTLDVNGFGISPNYFFLQALELGSVPKFRLTAENANVLQYTAHTNFLSTHYEINRNLIREMYLRWVRAFEIIGCKEIVNHETLRAGVFRTTYRSGVSVTVNYNRFPVEIDGELIPAWGYIITGGER